MSLNFEDLNTGLDAVIQTRIDGVFVKQLPMAQMLLISQKVDAWLQAEKQLNTTPDKIADYSNRLDELFIFIVNNCICCDDGKKLDGQPDIMGTEQSARWNDRDKIGIITAAQLAYSSLNKAIEKN